MMNDRIQDSYKNNGHNRDENRPLSGAHPRQQNRRDGDD